MNKLLYLLLIAVCWSCSQDSETEKHQSKRDQVVDVRDKMKEFSTQDVLIGRISRTYLIDNYLIVTDYNSPDKLIHLFDKNTFEHLASSTYQGQGPDEITIIGHVGRDKPPLLCIGSRQTENIRLRPGQCFNDSGISAKCKNRYEEKTVSG